MADLSIPDPSEVHARTLRNSSELSDHWKATEAIGELGEDVSKLGVNALSRTVLANGFEGCVRWRASESLAQLGSSAGPDAAQSLAHAMLHKKPGQPGADVYVRSGAASSLGKLGDAASGAGADALAEVLRHDISEQVRRRAAISLGEIGADAAGEVGQAALARALRWDQDEHVRYRAAESLGLYNTGLKEVAISALLMTVAKDPNAGVRGHAAHALGTLGYLATDVVVKALFKAQKSDTSDAVRRDASAALEMLRASCVQTLRNAGFHEFVRGSAAKALGELGDFAGQEALEALAVALLREAQYVRRRAAEALCALGTDASDLAAAAASRAAEKDEDAFVQWTAGQFMEAFGSAAATAAAGNAEILAALDTLLREHDESAESGGLGFKA